MYIFVPKPVVSGGDDILSQGYLQVCNPFFLSEKSTARRAVRCREVTVHENFPMHQNPLSSLSLSSGQFTYYYSFSIYQQSHQLSGVYTSRYLRIMNMTIIMLLQWCFSLLWINVNTHHTKKSQVEKLFIACNPT
jgi:hypothetical protein